MVGWQWHQLVLAPYSDRQQCQYLNAQYLQAGVMQNNPQCQISLIHAVERVRSRKVSYTGVYLFLAQLLKIGLRLVLVFIIPTSRANLVLRVIWQCDRFGMTPDALLMPTVSSQSTEGDFNILLCTLIIMFYNILRQSC